MISHALTIVKNELNQHLSDAYGSSGSSGDVAVLGNLAEGVANGATTGGVQRDRLVLSLVNIKEEKALKNLRNQTRNDALLKVVYENPPVFINGQILVAATHSEYTNALLMLSRAIRFFQFRNVFTHDNVAPASITSGAPANALDQIESFKLIFDLYSPSMEEINHLWGTLGGKQYPFALYVLRLLDLKFKATQNEGGLITEVVNDFSHKSAAARNA